jgi:hypothetical protein
MASSTLIPWSDAFRLGKIGVDPHNRIRTYAVDLDSIPNAFFGKGLREGDKWRH